MKRQSRQLIFLLVLLIAVVIAFFGVMQYNKIQRDDPASTAEERLIDIDRDTIVRFTYDYMGETYTYEKAEGVWRCVEAPDIVLNQNKVIAMTNRFAQVAIEQTIENVTDMSQYGLSEGYRVLSYETDTESYALHIGNYNEVTRVYYICKPSENTVYAVPTELIGSIDRRPEDLEDTTSAQS